MRHINWFEKIKKIGSGDRVKATYNMIFEICICNCLCVLQYCFFYSIASTLNRKLSNDQIELVILLKYTVHHIHKLALKILCAPYFTCVVKVQVDI